MKPSVKSDCKWPRRGFVDAVWRTPPPNGHELSAEDIFSEGNAPSKKKKSKKKKSEKKRKCLTNGQPDQSNDNPMPNKRLSRDVDQTEKTIMDEVAVFSQDLDDTQKGNSKKKLPALLVPALASSPGIARSSMQIMEDHLLEHVSIRRLYGAIYLYNGMYYAPLTEQDYAILLRRESNDRLISILKTYRQFGDGYRFLSSNPDIEFKDYNKNSVGFKSSICFKNVLLDVANKKTYVHDPEYPVFFGVDACYEKKPGKTPYWDDFIESVSQGDEKIKILIHEMLGYLLLQGNDGKCFFVLATAPNSGKSLLGDFIESLFPGEYVSHTAIDNLSDRFALGGLWKTVVNVSMDLPQSTLSAQTVSIVKTITGDSKITTEEKYMPTGTALNRCKLVFGTNSQISISMPDEAFWDRLIIVPFLYEVPRSKRRRDLLAHFIEEKDSIVSKCIPYLRKLIKRNYEFTMPEVSVSMKTAWSNGTFDTVGMFFSQYCEIADDSQGISVEKLFGHYQNFCQESRLPLEVENMQVFSKKMQAKYPGIIQKKCRIPEKDNPVSVFKNVNYYSD